MIITIFFVLSAVMTVNWLLFIMGCLLGVGAKFPVPFLHYFSISIANCYLSYPALSFQVWFWANYCGVV